MMKNHIPFSVRGAAQVSWMHSGRVPYVVLVPYGDEHMRPDLIAERKIIANEEFAKNPSLNGPAHWMAMGVWDCVYVALSGHDEHRLGAYAPIYAAALSREIETLEGSPAPFITVEFHPTLSPDEGMGSFMWARSPEKNYKTLKRKAEKARPTYFPRATIGLELVVSVTPTEPAF